MTHRQRIVAFIWRHSFGIRAALAGICLVGAVGAWSSAGEPVVLTRVSVAARDIPAGAVLSASDVAEGQDSLGLTTPAADRLVGEIVRGPVARGEPITESRITPGRTVATPRGTVVFPLTLADQRIADLLGAGDHVNVLVTPDSLQDDARGSQTIDDVEVLTVPHQDGGLARPSLGNSGAVVLLAVSDQQADQLAGIRRSDHVTVAIR